MRKRSKKRAAQEREYEKKRKAFLEENPLCQVRAFGCSTFSTEVHHKAGRIGNLLTDETKFLAVCRNCHQVIEMNPKMAKEKGFSISRLAVENQ